MIILKHRSIILISGIDINNFLQNLLTNNVSKCEENNPIYAVMLSPKGKILYDFFVLKSEKYKDSLLLDIPIMYIDEIINKFDSYKLRSKIVFEKIQEDIVVCSDLDGVYINDIDVDNGDILMSYTDVRSNKMGSRIYILQDNIKKYENERYSSKFTQDLNLYHKKRLEIKLPEITFDFLSGQFFTFDLNLDNFNAIDYTKGCYIGQEVVARVHYRNSSPRSIYLINSDIKNSDVNNGVDCSNMCIMSFINNDIYSKNDEVIGCIMGFYVFDNILNNLCMILLRNEDILQNENNMNLNLKLKYQEFKWILVK